jgi:hypothetical protein
MNPATEEQPRKRPCGWSGCQRMAIGKKTLCRMHSNRRLRGQDMDAPARYKEPRTSMRDPRINQYEILKPRLCALLRERAQSAGMLSAALGIARNTAWVWVKKLGDAGEAYVEQFTLPNPRSGPTTYYFIYTGKYPDNYPADEELEGANE